MVVPGLAGPAAQSSSDGVLLVVVVLVVASVSAGPRRVVCVNTDVSAGRLGSGSVRPTYAVPAVSLFWHRGMLPRGKAVSHKCNS